MNKMKRPLALLHVYVWDGRPDLELPAYTKGEARAKLKKVMGPLWGVKLRRLRTEPQTRERASA